MNKKFNEIKFADYLYFDLLIWLDRIGMQIEAHVGFV